MVFPLVPASATARVFSEGSTLAVQDSCLDTLGQSEAFSSNRRCLLRFQALDYCVSKPLYSHAERRNLASFKRRILILSENKKAPDLLEFARKAVNLFANSSTNLFVPASYKTSSRGKHIERDIEDSKQSGTQTEQGGKKSGSHFKTDRLVLDSAKSPILFPAQKRTVWTNIRTELNGFEATPLAPIPPFTGSLFTFLGFVLIFGVILGKWIEGASRGVQRSKSTGGEVETSGQLKAPTGIAVFLESDLKKKESVEWVNMVIGKLWKVYRLGLESWLVGLLQPLIDDLQKPGYVKRVQIKQFYLGDEPMSVRSVERRASRRANDLQYHIGLRYTGGARMLLSLKLKWGFFPITIPVGVRGLDVDGELWVKLRLVPSEPWVGTATWAFVSLPKIKLDLSPFRLFNLMAIPFLSAFLTKLLTQDLPQLFVRPNKNVIDFLKGKAVGPVPKNFKGATLEGNKDFAGELSVTLVDARMLNYIPYAKTDPYVYLSLGDQVIRSKKNSQTSVIGPPGGPIWNQDFQLLVVDPKTQGLDVWVRDYLGLTSFTVGFGEVELSTLQDTVPTDRVVTLRGGWGPFKTRFAGEILLRLTYTAYVEDDDEDRKGDRALPSTQHYTHLNKKADKSSLVNEMANKAIHSVEGKESINDVLAALVAEFKNGVLEQSSDTTEVVEAMDTNETSRVEVSGVTEVGEKNKTNDGSNKSSLTLSAGGSERTDDGSNKSSLTLSTGGSTARTVLLWLGLVTGLVVLVDISLNFTNFLNP